MTDDIIRNTLSEIDHGCDGFSYEMQKFLDDFFFSTKTHKNDIPWLNKVNISFEFPEIQKLAEGKSIPALKMNSRIIKLELVIDEDKLDEVVYGH